MSCFIVSKKHIDSMVSKTDRATTREQKTLNKLGQILWDENRKSVSHRYSEQTDFDTYKYESPEKELTPIEVIKLCHCYNYQSCEHPKWEGSKAQNLSQNIEDNCIYLIEGYDNAKWAI